MKQVTEKSFLKYGKILDLDCKEIIAAMETYTPLPDGVEYIPSETHLESLSSFARLRDEVYGGLDIEFGYCNGDNHLLNAVEYHRSSEVDIAATDLILILGWQQDIDLTTHAYDTEKMEVFFVPKGTAVELYATTLHYVFNDQDLKDGEISEVLQDEDRVNRIKFKILTVTDRIDDHEAEIVRWIFNEFINCNFSNTDLTSFTFTECAFKSCDFKKVFNSLTSSPVFTIS